MSRVDTTRPPASLDELRRFVLEVAEGLDHGSRYVSELLAVLAASRDLADYDARISDPARAARFRVDGSAVSDGGRGLSWLDQETWATMDLWERTLANLITAETRMMFRFEGKDRELLDPVLRRVARRGEARVLCVPCSTGKEVFSYAIVARRANLDVRVTGVDRQRAYVERARTGKLIYHWRDREFEDAERWLEVDGPRAARVKGDVLELCSFETGDVVEGVLPAGPFDLVASRNLLGYFRGPALVRAVQNLDARLRPGGILFLDPFVLGDPQLADAPRWLEGRGYRKLDADASYLVRPD